MKYKISCLLMFLGFSFQAHAIVISFDPNPQHASVGDTVSVDLRISDLGDDILTGFDLDISFDDSILAYEDFTFGTGLDTFGFGTLNAATDFGLGTVNVFELSFDFDDDLKAFQPDDFVLGTFSFTALDYGVSALDISVLGLAGEYVFDDTLNDFVASALFPELVSGSVIVLEPGTLLLLLGGVLGIGLHRRS